RCGGADAEHGLRAWLALGAPLRNAAGWALGAIAARDDRLEDATLVALLDAAAAQDAPAATAFQAFTRLSRLHHPVRARPPGVAPSRLPACGARSRCVRCRPRVTAPCRSFRAWYRRRARRRPSGPTPCAGSGAWATPDSGRSRTRCSPGWPTRTRRATHGCWT